MRYPKLFSEYAMGGMVLKNRFLMAPMTRSRSSQPGDIPNGMMAQYYGQRSSAGIIISEATQISLQAKGYANTPGIYTKEQIEGWKKITDAVHEKGSLMFLQLWHVGRISSSLVNGMQPIAPSAVRAEDVNVYVFDGQPDGLATMVPVETPREMNEQDIELTKQAYVQGALNAMKAGFNGVEIHGANGYLIDEFLRSNTNKRTDKYGGSQENRVRFLLEITQLVAEAVGKEKVGVRFSPFVKFMDTQDPEILETILLAAKQLNALGIAYIHIAESDWAGGPALTAAFRETLRQTFHHTIIVTGSMTPETGESLLEKGYADLIGFGRSFIANPDLPARVFQGAKLNEITDGYRLFGGLDHRGYTDYSALESEKAVEL